MAVPSGTEKAQLGGEAGQIEMLVDRPAGAPRGIAVVAHPHPLLGGSATHKVPHQLAKALVARGFLTVRPNFRGVEGSAGQHDQGSGEAQDMLAVVAHLREAHPGLPLALAGFSFGAFVMANAAATLAARSVPIRHLVLAGTPYGTVKAHRSYDTPAVPADCLVVHGERDERAELGALFDWARPQGLPVVVVPGADHFFTGKLPLLVRIVGGYLDRPEAGAAA
ncbi:Alpha/beta superfamily hydrolase [Cupriavidus necator]|uniref:Alpha/beta fold hydrolase n=1 Tax=Cupriavidus necator (strain ATCC 17699 / DSM 428 / KCTC 22496 / NCIMB 10442 / H16 / Stanier 337) TaxID=381666 RepID=Q0K038_CUPNH|nr:alpha/beta fold hydrolase [Cupriavidus necator]KUE90718.1 GntR family transcriptional regulator [Cupriavidus necator]QCC04459.1 alpha/beta fold hydrolase [Cupriavidus necator H16]QQB79149.1 alpha/beta fold hydrolase [Cupriavidus necator]WKA43369.1 alpha/beta fold hydrolase [Cupriavidus necator]CAJ96636.1 putative hydrolase alpha/beta fold [Cupriavidus necator H16]